MDRSTNYQHKSDTYFKVAQSRVADFITGHGNRILEIGCGEGHTGAFLKETGKATEVHGVELVPDVAAAARKRLDSVITGDLETIKLPFEPQSFDYIVATETLEHLAVPEQVLERIRPLLKPNGQIIASVPNLRHARLIWHLVVQGDWRYTDAGPLDRTHLRFFTRKSFERLFAESGYTIIESIPVLLPKGEFLNRVTLGVFEGFLAFRLYCIAEPSNSKR